MQTESLTPEVLFQRIQKYFGPHDIDIFASKTNHKLNTFMCWKYCPQASSTNSFNHTFHPEYPPGENHINSNHAVMEISSVVFGPKKPINCSTNQEPSFISHPRPDNRKICDNIQ
ncbi:hypothetical protein AYI70_g4833 [Smittium culicis]|uniref:Uncharacterized protein n=1 Tax=Smittium culicis TaxID=133412 RepID=A0A1R1XXM7_9FUNG|nr:hypothetical protein AYI70_g4833 [Smittium culicis]